MALFPTQWLDAVVAIGVDSKTANEPAWIGTGFLYGHPATELRDGKQGFYGFLVSNRHVFQGKEKIYVRFNPKSDEVRPGAQYELKDKSGSPVWMTHPNPDVDVAVLGIDIDSLEQKRIRGTMIDGRHHIADRKKMEELSVSEGDFVYALGFPMGMVGGPPNAVIVRGGVISRIQDVLSGNGNYYLIDAFCFPGNSGGPVLLKPEALYMGDTKPSNTPLIVGIVTGYIPYTEEAISKQTGVTRIVFQENSGLTAVHPMDFVLDVVEEQLKKQGIDT